MPTIAIKKALPCGTLFLFSAAIILAKLNKICYYQTKDGEQYDKRYPCS